MVLLQSSLLIAVAIRVSLLALTYRIHVVVSRSERNFFEADAEFEYLRLPYDDHSDAPLHRSFDEAMAFIDRARLRGASVLVHCRAGVSRSATVVLAYLVQREKRSLRHAFLYLKAIRSVVDPNPGFWQQLVELEHKVHGATSVRLLQTPEHGLLPCIYLDHSAMRSLRVGTASFDESGVGGDDDYDNDDAEASNYDNEDEREQDQWCLDVEQSATRSFSSMPTVMPVGEQPSTHSGALDDLLASVYNVHEQSRRRRRCEEDDTDHEGAGTDGGSSCIVS